MIRSLMTSRRFAPLFWCQFLAAFNDNVLKNALVFLIVIQMGEAGNVLVTLATALFVAPPMLLSGLAGQWADRFDKSAVIRRLKFFEIVPALLAVAGFALSSLPILFVALALFSIVAALFGPVKYGILPDHLKGEELPSGNALVEGGTFVAILLGTIVGGQVGSSHGAIGLYGLVVVGFQVLCWLSSLLIPATPEASPHLRIEANVLHSTHTLLAHLYADTRLWRCAVYSGWFWLIGAVVLSLVPTLVKDRLGGTEACITVAIGIFSIGIALGSGLASWLASGRVILLPTVIGSLIIGLFGLDLAFAAAHAPPADAPLGAAALFLHGTGLRAAIGLFGLAIGGGLFVVPTFTALQAWSAVDYRARTVGGANVLAAVFMVAGAVILALLQGAGLSTPTIFALVGIASLIAAGVILRTLPTSAFRDLISIMFRVLYRLEIRGYENIAKGGPNPIIALNHVSFLDAGLALSLLDRDPVFAIDRTIAQQWWVRPFLRLTRAMPLDPTKPMATRALIQAVQQGETLVIFPEGRLTVTGSLMKVYDGAGLIADRAGVPVVPIRIEGLERTVFSYLNRQQIRPGLLPKLDVSIEPPVRLDIDPALVGKRRRQAAGAALYDVMSNLVYRTIPTDSTLFEAVVAGARQHGWSRVMLEDPVTGKLTYKRLILASHILATRIVPLAGVGRAVGIMLPNANGAAVTLLAVLAAGRLPAMINFSAGSANILSACRAAEVEVILTSRAFIEKGKLEAVVAALEGRVRLVYLEDLRAGIGTMDKLGALLAARRPLVARKPDDPAIILFTSGSEGTPKGVVLTHRNILANIAMAVARIDFGRADKVFNVLPVFHAFGLTAGLLLPLIRGVPVYLYPSPLHYRIIPELVYGTNATVLFGTDTFLAGYARSANPYDFRSLRYVVAGAEPVKEPTRQVWLEKFGLRILEGYGVTETAPVLALNTPMFNKFGTVGQLLPGIEARLDPVPGIAEGGRLVVRGANVMSGYLRAENPGVIEPPPEGWHDTGDIATIDAEGFVAIKGRAKRFAKIGGEMVSLAAVETVAADLWTEAQSAAAAVPDPRKGERIVLVTDQKDATRGVYLTFAKSRGVPELAVPAEIIVVDQVPLLGSGKLDHPAIARLVKEHMEARGTAEVV